MFVDNIRDRKRQGRELGTDEELAQVMDEIPFPDSSDDMLVGKKNNNNAQLPSAAHNKNDIGVTKNPSRFMLSEGTLIHAYCLQKLIPTCRDPSWCAYRTISGTPRRAKVSSHRKIASSSSNIMRVFR